MGKVVKKGDTVVIGGGRGFIGRSVTTVLENAGYNVVIISRSHGPRTATWADLAKSGLPVGCTAVINLAGQGMFGCKEWCMKEQQRVWSSRICTTRSLARAIDTADCPPSVFICISGLGKYACSDFKQYTEDSVTDGESSFAKYTSQWEDAAHLKREDVRMVTIRAGWVLGQDAGLIRQLYWPWYLGFGCIFGSGDQFMPWIHVDDLARLFLHVLESRLLHGVVFGVVPEIITNKYFVCTYATFLKRHVYLRIPEALLSKVLGKGLSTLITGSYILISTRALDDGFVFKYATLHSAFLNMFPS